jgi:hypothetical protein
VGNDEPYRDRHREPPSEVFLSATYTVNADCCFTLIDPEGRANDGVFVLDRPESFFIETVEGVFMTYTMKRVAEKGEQD